MDHKPLFEPGFRDWPIDAIEQRFDEVLVRPFDSPRRRYLARRFFQLVEDFKKFGVAAEVWVDGSFVTSKLSPGDIDIVFVVDHAQANWLPLPAKNRFQRFSDQAYIMELYDCHLFVIRDDQEDIRNYLAEDWFATSRDDMPKGLVRFYI